MMLIFLSTSWMLSMTFIFLHHPLSFGFILLAQTTIITISSGILNLNYWFSYILFLIMIGGMLVLFIYMTSVASNEKFKFSNKLLMFHTIVITLISLLLFSDSFFSMIDMTNLDSINQSNSISLNLSISKFFNYPNTFTMIMIIFYLLLTLIAIVKITYSKMGPFRQMST